MNNDSRINVLGSVKVSKAIMIQALPATVGLVVSGLYITVDSMFVSWLGTDYASASQIIFPLINLISAIGFIYGVGGGSYIARLLGQGDSEKANKTASTSIFLAFVCGIVFSLAAFAFMPQIVEIFGAQTENVKALAITYGRILMIGSIFQIANVCFNNLLRSEGSVTHSMKSMIVASVINLILDPILIFGFDMGIAGAAVATVIAQIINFILLFRVYLSQKSVAKFSKKYICFEKDILDETFKIGIPTFFKQALLALSLVVLNNLVVSVLGDNGLAAVGNSSRAISMITMMIFGYGQGYQPICGYSYGAKNYARVYEATKVALRVSAIFCIAVSIFLFVKGDLLLLMFMPTEEVLAIGTTYIKYQAISLTMMGIGNTISIYFMAIGNAKVSGFLSVARQGIFFLPLAYILPYLMNYTAESVYLVQPLSDVLMLIVSMFLFIPAIKKLKQDAATN